MLRKSGCMLNKNNTKAKGSDVLKRVKEKRVFKSEKIKAMINIERVLVPNDIQSFENIGAITFHTKLV